MFTHHFDNLPLCLLQADPKRPQRSFDQNNAQNPLFRSIRKDGIERPIVVCALDDGTYCILDGMRRFRCAQALKMETVPCQVYSRLTPGELSGLRALFRTANPNRIDHGSSR